MIAEKQPATGCGKAGGAWFDLDHVYIAYDHPFNINLEHALTLDFVNEAQGPGARVAVELTPATARALANGILEALARAGE
jgi:hypothetical protein